jgi:hypothetical protein
VYPTVALMKRWLIAGLPGSPGNRPR